MIARSVRMIAATGLGVTVAALLTPSAQAGFVSATRVTQDHTLGSYVRYDGSSDPVMTACSTSRRQQNEPSVATDPHNPQVVVAGANDNCDTAAPGVYQESPLIAHGWMGYYRSTDGGTTWTDSLVPGYPTDTSPAGLASPTHQCTEGSDPTQAFDNQGRLYYAFLCYNRDKPQYGGLYVATYDNDGSTYRGTVQLDRGAPALMGEFNDKPNLVVDTSGGPTDGNVYVFWDRFFGLQGSGTVVATSTDHGATFSRFSKIYESSGGGYQYPTFPDASVGPHGEVYAVIEVTTVSPKKFVESFMIVKSTDAGRTFTRAREIVYLGDRNFAGGLFSGGGGIYCGDGPLSCPNGMTFPRFQSTAAVVADATGVHVVWNQMLPGEGTTQSKVFVKTSPDGLTGWDAPGVPVDSSTVGHQMLPDIASADGTIDVVFYDSRHDPAYSPHRPPGLTADGKNSGPAVDTIVARSADGGATWSETTVSSVASNFNYELGATLQLPFFGDYIYISATHGAVHAVWTSNQDVVPGVDPRQGPDDADGFDVYAPCTWSPDDINAGDYSSPGVSDPCLSQGGKDSNIYTAGL